MSVKDKLKSMGVAARAKDLGLQAEAGDDSNSVQHWSKTEGGKTTQADRYEPRVEADPLPLSDAEQWKPEKQGVAASAASNGLQGLTYGAADEIQGGMGAGLEALKAATGHPEERPYSDDFTGVPAPEKSTLERVLAAYTKTRDNERAAVKQGEKDNPGTALVSKILGGVAAPSLPGMGVAKGAKGLGLVGQGAKSGLISGGAYGAGASEADSPGGVAKDALISGAAGAGTGAVLGGVNALVQKYLANLAESQAGRAVGMEGGISDKMRRMGVGDEEARHELARTALDEGLLGGIIPPSKATVADRARGLVDQSTNSKNAILANAEVSARTPFDPGYAAAKARGALTNLDPRAARLLGPAVKSVEDIEALKHGINPGSVVAADKLKSSLQAGNDYSDPSIFNKNIAKRLDKKVAASLRQAIEEHVNDATGAGDELHSVNRKIGQGLKLEEIAKNAASRSAQRNAVGLGDKMIGANVLGGAMAAGGSPLDAIGTAGGYGLIHNLLNQYGNATAAKGADALAKGGGIAPALNVGQSLASDEDKKRRLEEMFANLLGQ